MSRSPIRKDKTCLNCNYVVESKFCPNCGQENSESRKTFHHLFIHFFEDLTHYENSFWRTIKNLIFKPASLTKEYLSGKRMSYLAPIRLYIFISFVTFFIISLLPTIELDGNKHEKENRKSNSKKVGVIEISFDDKEFDNKDLSPQAKKIKQFYVEGQLSKKEADTLMSYANKSFEKQSKVFSMGNIKFKSIKELDSIQKHGKLKLNNFQYWLSKKIFKVTRSNSSEQLKEKFLESIQHNIPKALFLFMPIFALLLWLFHNKKRWYYFDHGIFTLHYFSFLLAVVLIYNIIDTIFYTFHYSFVEHLSDFVSFGLMLWSIYYFYKAHKSFYKESKTKSFLKSTALFALNMIFMGLIVSALVLYSFINIH